MAKIRGFFGVLLVLVSLCFGVRSEETPLVFINARDEHNSGYQWLQLVYDEAFKRLGKDYEVRIYPDKRGELLLVQGIVDGDLARTKDFIVLHPNLILVPVAVAWTNVAAFTTREDLVLQQWEDLALYDLRVEYRRGSVLAETRLVPIIKPENLSIANDWETGIRKLLAGRTDVYVDMEVDVMSLLASGAFPHANLKMAGILEKVYGYPILHPKNAALAKPLEKVLGSMTREGLIECYRRQALEAGSSP